PPRGRGAVRPAPASPAAPVPGAGPLRGRRWAGARGMGGGGGGRRAAPGGGTRSLPGGLLGVVERLLHLPDGLGIAAEVAAAQGGLRGGVGLLGLLQVPADE